MATPACPARLTRARAVLAPLRDARGLLVILLAAAAFSAASVVAFRAICARADRLEARAASEQLDRIAFSRRNGPAQ